MAKRTRAARRRIVVIEHEPPLPALDEEGLRRAARFLSSVDPVMARLIAQVGPPRHRHQPAPLFPALTESIVYQQITGKAAETIHGRLCKALGRRRPRPVDVLAASDEAMRGAGLSRMKITYLRDLARRCQDGLPVRGLARLGDQAIIEALTTVKGIGRWTVEMYLMFRLGRPDVLPVGDYGVRKAMQRAYRMRARPTPDRMRRLAAPWRPYRSLACWYLWRSLDNPAGRA